MDIPSCVDVLKVLAYLRILQMHSQSQAHGSDLYGVAPNTAGSERHIGFMIECSTPGSYSTTLSNLLLPCRLTCLHTPRDTGLKFWLMAGA